MIRSAVRTASAQSTEPMILPRVPITTPQALRVRIGVATGLALLLLLLPMHGMGQVRSVESLIEQGEKVGANPDLMRAVADRAETAGLSPETTADLLQPALSLAEKNLPSSPLLNKTLEGFAKQVPPARMTPVLQRIQSHTEQAGAVASAWLDRADVQEFVGESATSSTARNRLISNITEAQQQDIPLENVGQFLEQLPASVERRPVSLSEVSTAVSVMPDLPGPSNAASVNRELLSAALQAGYDAESLDQLPAALERARQESQRPMTSISKGVARAIAQNTPASTVLRSLFQGSVPGGGPPTDVGNGPPTSPPGQGKPPGGNGEPPVDPGQDPPVGPPGESGGGG